MNSSQWKTHFSTELHSNSNSLQSVEPGADELIYNLKNKIITDEKYLEWALEHYQIPVLKSEYFLNHKVSTEILKKFQNIYAWSETCLPLAEWEGYLYVACLEPKTWAPELKLIPVLCAYSDLQKTWSALHAQAQEPAKNHVQSSIEPEAAASAQAQNQEPSAAPILGKLNISAPPSSTSVEDMMAAAAIEELNNKDTQSGETDKEPSEDSDGKGGLAPEGFVLQSSASSPLQPLLIAKDKEANSEGNQPPLAATPESVAVKPDAPVLLQADAATANDVLVQKPAMSILEKMPPKKSEEASEPVLSETQINAQMPQIPPRALEEKQTQQAESPSVEQIPPALPIIGANTKTNIDIEPQTSVTKISIVPATVDEVEALKKPKEAPPKINLNASPLKDAAHLAAAKKQTYLLDMIAKDKPQVFQTETKSAFTKMKMYFTKSMVISCDSKGNYMKPVAWDESFKDNPDAIPIDAKIPSIFRIAESTQKPFHGPIVFNEINKKFMDDWNNSEIPGHATIIPLISNEKVVGLLVGFADVTAYNKVTLQAAEKIADELINNLIPGKAKVA